MNHPNPMPNTSPARSAAHGHARAVKQPSPSERPAALDNLLAHIAHRIDQIEASTLARHHAEEASDE